jgi:hypothetical protein
MQLVVVVQWVRTIGVSPAGPTPSQRVRSEVHVHTQRAYEARRNADAGRVMEPHMSIVMARHRQRRPGCDVSFLAHGNADTVHTVGITTAATIREAGFDIVSAPTSVFLTRRA